MAINKKLIHFKTFANFNSQKLSANEANTKYTIGVNNTVYDGSPDILYHSICYIKDKKLQWTHGQLYCDTEGIREELNKIAERVDENEEVASNAIFNLQEAVETNELITTEAISDIQENINILDNAIVEFNDNLETQNYIITDIFESIENQDKVVSASLEHINQVIKDNEESVTASMLALNDKIPTKASQLDNDISYATEKFVADKINKFNFKTINGNSVLGNGDIIIPNEIEFINISRKLLDNPPIYTIGEIKAIINSYNANKLIAIKSSDNLTFGKGWFIPNIRITKQEERYYTLFVSGIIGRYYIEHNISYDSLAGIISTTAQDPIDLSEIGGTGEEYEDVRYFTDFTVEHFMFVENADSSWRVGTIADLGTVVGGGTPSKAKTEYYTEDGIAWITPKDLSIDKSKFIAHGENDISELGYRNSSATMMPAGTVLFSSRAPIGYIAIASNEVTTNQGFKSVVPHSEIGTPFVYYFLLHNLPLIESKASGSTFKEVSGSVMKSVEAVIPDDDTLAKFNYFCRPVFEMQRKLEQENRKMAAMRDSLLPRLMSGEIDVADIEI